MAWLLGGRPRLELPDDDARRGAARAVIRALERARPPMAGRQELDELRRGAPRAARDLLEGQGPSPDGYVTLDRMAASVGRSKRTLEKLKARQQNPLPAPDIEGGGGMADYWLWAKVLPWLESQYRRKLPERCPAAGIPYRDAGGRVADFHALRPSYITLLEHSGVSPKLAQEWARHSHIRLTLNVYTHARLHDPAGAVEGPPALLPCGPRTEATALKATGTNAESPTKAVASLPPAYQKADSQGGSVRADERTRGGRAPPADPRQVLKLEGVDGGCGRARATERKLPGLDSNQDKRNQNPLCYRYTTG